MTELYYHTRNITSNKGKIVPSSWPMTFAVPSIVGVIMNKISLWIAWLKSRNLSLCMLKVPTHVGILTCIWSSLKDSSCSEAGISDLNWLHKLGLFSGLHVGLTFSTLHWNKTELFNISEFQERFTFSSSAKILKFALPTSWTVATDALCHHYKIKIIM